MNFKKAPLVAGGYLMVEGNLDDIQKLVKQAVTPKNPKPKKEERLRMGKTKYVTCGGCGKKIHIDKFGGIINGDFVHNNIVCLTRLKKKHDNPKPKTGGE